MRQLTLLITMLLFFVSQATGQTTFGSITGVVTDPSGAVVPGVTVSVTNEGTGLDRKVVTSSGGVFNVPNLDVGTYRVTVTAPGFATYERSGLVLSSNQVLNIDASLKLETASTVTEVQAATPAISTETSSLSDVKSNQVLQQLPLEMSRHAADKGFYTYTFLSTGTSSVTSTSIPVINGVRTQSGTLPTMDGIAVTAYSGGASPVQPSFEAIQEVNVLTANPSAEFAVAANYTVVTKSGTNDFHGTAFYNYNSHVLNSRNFFATERPLRVYNNFGASLGGPIKKNKLFFFGDYEGSREAARRLMTANVPLVPWRSGDFSGFATTIVDPTNLGSDGRPTPFPGNRIPESRISPVSKNVQEVFPLPNFGAPTLQAGNYRQLFVGTTGFTRFNMVDGRIDYNLSSRDLIFGRMSWRRMPLDGYHFPPSIGHYPQRRYGHSGVISWSHTFSPALLNEFRTGVTYHRNSYHYDTIGSDLIQQWGIKGITATGAPVEPNFRIDPVTNFETDVAFNNPSTTLQWIDNLSWTRCAHCMKFGVDIIRDRLNETSITPLIYGGYNFTGIYTNFGYADFLLGIPQTTQLAVDTPPRYLRATTWAFYAQDQFKVNRKLTLNYGLRWQLAGPFYHQFGAIYSFNPETGALVIPDEAVSRVNPYFPKNIPIQTASQADYPQDALVDFPKDSFQPRFGFAYKPFAGGNMVIRGAYGIFGNLIYRPLARDMGGGPFAGSATFVNSITNGVPLFSFPEPFLTSAIGAVGTQDVQGKDPNLKNPYTQQWNLTIEQEVKETALRVSYMGTRTVNLPYRRNLNLPPPSTIPFSAIRRTYPQYNQVIWTENGGTEFYNGLEVSATKRYGKNFSFGAGWTWARDLTDSQDSGGGGTSFGGQVIQDQYDRQAEKADNALVLKHRAFGYAIYALPFGRGQRFLSGASGWVEGLLGGWQTSWNVNLQSGQYFHPTFAGRDPSNTNTIGGRPDRIGDGNIATGERTLSRWFDASAFKIPGCPDSNPICPESSRANVGRFGNAGLNILEGPGISNLDFALGKYFTLRENTRLQFRLIMVNALNHPNFAVPSSNINNTNTVGTITSMARVLNGEPSTREVNLGLRLEF
jgi:Carboxypeptidase regulatory-like domain/TonB dependent receptor-like, beta-barrel